jgi:hypothetical protein
MRGVFQACLVAGVAAFALGVTSAGARTLTAPDTFIDTSPASTTSSSTAEFTFHSDDGSATFECKLDNGAYLGCTSPHSYTNLADGTHTFAVRAINSSQEVDATPATWQWTIDTTPPDTSITVHPDSPTNSSDAYFSFTSTGGSGFECSLDGALYTSCTDPQDYPGLPDGSHTFAVRAIDGIGNADPTPASFAWTIDTTPPDTTINSNPTNPQERGTDATFTFSANESSIFACNLDGAGYTPCTSPKTYSNLDVGPHTFLVRATDLAGNDETVPAEYDWNVTDTVAPDTEITDSPDAATNSTSAEFDFDADEPATFECRIEPAAFTSCTSPQTYSGLADGTYTFDVRATDPSSNVDPTPASFAWTVDTHPPTVTLDSAPNNPTKDKGATFTFYADEPATFSCLIDGDTRGKCPSPAKFPVLRWVGSHTFEIIPTDTAGNVGAPAFYTWTNGKVPKVKFTGTPAKKTTDTNATFVFGSSDQGATYTCSFDGGGATPCTSPKTYTGLGIGTHTLTVVAGDAAGRSSKPKTFSWTITA